MAKNFIIKLYFYYLQQLKDKNNKDKNLKTKIYYIALKTIIQYIYISFISKKNDMLII